MIVNDSSYIPEDPYKKIEESQVKPLCERQWTIGAIAGYLGVSRQTLKRQFGEKLHDWKLLGQANLLDRAWLRIQDKNYKNERLFVEMMKRYVWKTHMDKIRIQKILDPNEKNKDDTLAELYSEIQIAFKTQEAWASAQIKQAKEEFIPNPPMGLLTEVEKTDDISREDSEVRTE